MVSTAGSDPLRDEGRSYGERLRNCGIRCGFARFSNRIPAFLSR
ncbi:MAG: alpha/beta hydrolase [Gammaproteobacteria bacterium]|nr:alpha/beta hydrolase [Gammaproteobacteria bacterium]